MITLRDLLVTACLTFFGGDALAQSAGVFVPYAFEPKQLMDSMKADPFFSKYDVKIFQKLEDFILASSTKPFDVAILPASYARFNGDYVLQIPLVNEKGESSFTHQVVAFKKDLAGDFSVAVIDEVGRKNLKKWLKEICSKCGKQKDVKKAKDLYNMLALGSVDAILVSPYNLETIKSESAAELFTILSGEKEDFPGVFVPKGKAPQGLDKIKPSVFAAMGLKAGGPAK